MWIVRDLLKLSADFSPDTIIHFTNVFHRLFIISFLLLSWVSYWGMSHMTSIDLELLLCTNVMPNAYLWSILLLFQDQS